MPPDDSGNPGSDHTGPEDTGPDAGSESGPDDSGPGDAELLARLPEGVETAAQAFETIYRRHYPQVLRFALRFVPSRDAAEDLVQTVFLRVWDRRQALNIRGSVRTYLLSAVRFEALDVVRHHQVVARSETLYDPEAPAGMGAGPAAPDDITEIALLRQRVRHALMKLSERQRTVILLRWQQGLDSTEIAEVLGIGTAAVYRLLDRAIDALKKAIEGASHK